MGEQDDSRDATLTLGMPKRVHRDGTINLRDATPTAPASVTIPAASPAQQEEAIIEMEDHQRPLIDTR